MAYRWQPEEYRKPHNGQSVFGGGMIPTIKHPDTTQADWRTPVSMGNQGSQHSRLSSAPVYMQPWSGEDETGNFTQIGANKQYTFTKPTPKSPYLDTENDGDGPDDDFKPLGGSTVPRKPKPNPKSPSGGMALPLPQKVK
jgi:hypothetical protein